MSNHIKFFSALNDKSKPKCQKIKPSNVKESVSFSEAHILLDWINPRILIRKTWTIYFFQFDNHMIFKFIHFDSFRKSSHTHKTYFFCLAHFNYIWKRNTWQAARHHDGSLLEIDVFSFRCLTIFFRRCLSFLFFFLSFIATHPPTFFVVLVYMYINFLFKPIHPAYTRKQPWKNSHYYLSVYTSLRNASADVDNDDAITQTPFAFQQTINWD